MSSRFGTLRRLAALAVGLVPGVSCESESSSPRSEPAPAAVGPRFERFGAALSPGSLVGLDDVLAEPSRHSGKTVLVEGHVRRACTKKGCWMELAAGSDPSAKGCRVTFRDYGFFVPTDSAGSRARVEAVVETVTLKPSHVRHLEEEGATFASKAPDGSAEEVRLVATGVELTRPGS